MSHLKIFGLVIGLVLIITGANMLYNSYKDKNLIKDTEALTEAKVNIKNLQEDRRIRGLENDSIKHHSDSLELVIEIQKNSPTIIYKNNEKSHSVIDNLDAYNAIKLFTTNIAYYKSNRSRFNGSRFVK